IVLGTRTYLEFAELWPGLDSPMADYMNRTPKHIASSTLDTVGWANSSLMSGDLAENVARLKQQPGKNIQIPGSPRLVRSLLRDGLLDEMTARVQLRLVQSATLSTGVLSVTYQPANA